MREKSSAIMVALMVTGVIVVIAGVALFAVNGSSSPKLSFTNHSVSRVLGSSSGPGSKSVATGSPGAPAASARPIVTPSLSPENTTYLVTGTIALDPAKTPIAGHEVDIVGSIPFKTFTDAGGHFMAHLPVGHYSLTLNPDVGPGGQSWPFTVARQPLTLNITAKSGR